MCRRVLLAVAMLLSASVAVRTDEADVRQALALQRAVQAAIRDAEPAIACILVSRSDVYARLGQKLNPDKPGELGEFSANALQFLPGVTEDELPSWRRKLDLADPSIVPESFGSGVVVGAQGLVLTNYHVVKDATKVFVRLPGRKGSYADIHAADARADLAVLRLLKPPVGLKTIALGEAEKCARGQFVLSIANPFAAGFRDGQPSASWGILSNIRRRVPGNPNELDRVKPLHQYGSLLQTDARLNLGCSGGALINLKGEMIGLTTALAAIQGGETPGGFAVPMDAGMRRIVDVLRRGEEIDYGFLGVSFDQGPGNGEGVRLSGLVRGSPAERDGQLQPGDRILEVNGRPIHESDDLFLALGSELAGTKVRMKVQRVRPGLPDNVQVTLAKFLSPGKSIHSSLGKRPFVRGLRVDHASLLVQPVANRFSRIPQGVMVSAVQPNTPAAAVPLKNGDVIAEVQGRPIASPADFYREMERQPGGVELTLDTGGRRPKVILGQ